MEQHSGIERHLEFLRQCQPVAARIGALHGDEGAHEPGAVVHAVEAELLNLFPLLPELVGHADSLALRIGDDVILEHEIRQLVGKVQQLLARPRLGGGHGRRAER